MTTQLRHEPFCLPRPGNAEPRVETFHAERWNDAGTVVVSRPVVTRCVECGTQEVEG